MNKIELPIIKKIIKTPANPIFFRSRSSQENAGVPWGGVTDPRHHNPCNFRYLVHAVHLPDSLVRCTQRLFIVQEYRQGRVQSNSRPIDLLENPYDIAEKPVISASLINQDRTGTWGPGGFILEVLPEHVQRTSPRDTGTDFIGLSSLRSDSSQPPLLPQEILTPEGLLERTDPYTYNEVVLSGRTKAGTPVRIVGIFIVKLPNGEVLDEVLAQKLRELAYRHKWPIVFITKKIFDYSDHRSLADVDVFDWLFAINIDGKRYLFNVRERIFQVFECGGEKQHYMSEEEKDFALKKLKQLLENADKTDPKYHILLSLIARGNLQNYFET